MMQRRRPYFYFLSLTLLVVSCSQPPIFNRGKTVYRLGDHKSWASKNLYDQDWQRDIAFVPDGKIFWSRTRIGLVKSPEPFQPFGIQLEVYGEYEVFWDGVLIGKNGNPGEEATLGPEGKLWTTYSIPVKLSNQGEHVLAIRSSLYYYPDHVGIWALDVDGYDELLTDQLIETSYMHIFAGAFLIASVYFLFLYLGNRRAYPMLVFSISCFLFFALTLTQFIRITVPIHYSLHVARLELIEMLMFCISFLIPLYFSMQFPFPKRKILLGIYAVILVILFSIEHNHYGFTANNMTLSMMIFSFAIVIFGVYKKEKGALLVLLTLFICVGIRFGTSFGITLFTGFSLILLSMMYLLSISIKEQRLAYENSLIQSTRLRLELLKKNIQPHFLMNTLTSLMDWVEEAPKKGVLFIEALAKEFELFNEIEKEKLIPIEQEISLCKTHLKIMEYRKEIKYLWEQVGINSDEKIPPAILHTLLENGITHSLPMEDNSVRFKLIFESDETCKRYIFLTYSDGVKSRKKDEGTGLKYVKARLEESYASKWGLASGPTENGWKNTIEIYR